MDVLHNHGAVRFHELNVREVPDGIDSVLRERTGYLNSCHFRNGENSDVNLIGIQIINKIIDGKDLDTADFSADNFRVYIEGALQGESPFIEAEIVHEGTAYMTDADENSGIPSVGSENRGDVVSEALDVVTVALLTETSETAEVLTDLRRSETELLAELKGRHAGNTCGRQLIQLSDVSRKTPDDII